MIAIIRGFGTTPSEQYLAKVAEKTFLNLWSYPNLFIDKKEKGKGTGKELCDLLVVFGDDVIIFSDKSVGWPNVEDVHLAWRRWYRRAIQKSVEQIRGAERWITEFPGRVFLDPACAQRLPIDLPNPDKRRVHGVIVAVGANEACRRYYPASSGTFVVAPRVKGDDHFSPDKDVDPFTIGDVNPDGSFVHVFDDHALDAVMRELDTVSDFTNYLIRREKIMRPEKLLAAAGEEDLLAYYLQAQDTNRQHDFVDQTENRLQQTN